MYLSVTSRKRGTHNMRIKSPKKKNAKPKEALYFDTFVTTRRVKNHKIVMWFYGYTQATILTRQKATIKLKSSLFRSRRCVVLAVHFVWIPWKCWKCILNIGKTYIHVCTNIHNVSLSISHSLSIELKFLLVSVVHNSIIVFAACTYTNTPIHGIWFEMQTIHTCTPIEVFVVIGVVVVVFSSLRSILL